jgi:hypothetical protein
MTELPELASAGRRDSRTDLAYLRQPVRRSMPIRLPRHCSSGAEGGRGRPASGVGFLASMVQEMDERSDIGRAPMPLLLRLTPPQVR